MNKKFWVCFNFSQSEGKLPGSKIIFFENSKCFLSQWRENCLGAESIFWKLQMFGEKFEDLDNIQSRPESPIGKIRLHSRTLWLLSCFAAHVTSGKVKNPSGPLFSFLTLVMSRVLSPANTPHTLTNIHRTLRLTG